MAPTSPGRTPGADDEGPRWSAAATKPARWMDEALTTRETTNEKFFTTARGEDDEEDEVPRLDDDEALLPTREGRAGVMPSRRVSLEQRAADAIVLLSEGKHASLPVDWDWRACCPERAAECLDRRGFVDGDGVIELYEGFFGRRFPYGVLGRAWNCEAAQVPLLAAALGADDDALPDGAVFDRIAELMLAVTRRSPAYDAVARKAFDKALEVRGPRRLATTLVDAYDDGFATTEGNSLREGLLRQIFVRTSLVRNGEADDLLEAMCADDIFHAVDGHLVVPRGALFPEEGPLWTDATLCERVAGRLLAAEVTPARVFVALNVLKRAHADPAAMRDDLERRCREGRRLSFRDEPSVYREAALELVQRPGIDRQTARITLQVLVDTTAAVVAPDFASRLAEALAAYRASSGDDDLDDDLDFDSDFGKEGRSVVSASEKKTRTDVRELLAASRKFEGRLLGGAPADDVPKASSDGDGLHNAVVDGAQGDRLESKEDDEMPPEERTEALDLDDLDNASSLGAAVATLNLGGNEGQAVATLHLGEFGAPFQQHDEPAGGGLKASSSSSSQAAAETAPP
eukprot:CAMPEP_0118889660 /NCGR_PEP_ID=MMETSP1166-20130328/481_1 /TAXON_ID=1104430 /ORGANISM="Chrysoreinhardia sp, Strain CCMP3193" /LENGTH=573 /DNA_ID=CAMNT_0006828253 /DNA_START=60 /DNA_END=1778 /DNA_ORIENTATION=+